MQPVRPLEPESLQTSRRPAHVSRRHIESPAYTHDHGDAERAPVIGEPVLLPWRAHGHEENVRGCRLNLFA
jgi:hypothetical protein